MTPPAISVVAAVIEDEGCFFVTRRQRGVHLEGLWEFPGGKVDPDETHQAALSREIREELDTGVEVLDRILTTSHAYDDRAVTLHFYRCRLTGTPKPMLGQAMQWVRRKDLGGLQFPPADAELIEMLTGTS